MGIQSPVRRCLVSLVLCAEVFAPALAGAGPIDVRQSKVPVFVYKTGLFSAFADNHVISAPIARGTIATAPSPAVDVVINAADLAPVDPDLDQAKRGEVRTRMLGADVLDTGRFPTITFASTTIESTGPDRWNVSGRLTIHGATRPITFPIVRSDGRYHGEVKLRQRDFNITPIRIAAGTVSVKDEIKIEFDIVAAGD